jgi:hypothetical protein
MEALNIEYYASIAVGLAMLAIPVVMFILVRKKMNEGPDK